MPHQAGTKPSFEFGPTHPAPLAPPVAVLDSSSEYVWGTQGQCSGGKAAELWQGYPSNPYAWGKPSQCSAGAV